MFTDITGPGRNVKLLMLEYGLSMCSVRKGEPVAFCQLLSERLNACLSCMYVPSDELLT